MPVHNDPGGSNLLDKQNPFPIIFLCIYAIASLLMKLEKYQRPEEVTIIESSARKNSCYSASNHFMAQNTHLFPFSSKGKLPRIHISAAVVSHLRIIPTILVLLVQRSIKNHTNP